MTTPHPPLPEEPESLTLGQISPVDLRILRSYLDWLESQGYRICRWREAGNNGAPKRVPATQEQLRDLRLEYGRYSFNEYEAEQFGVTNPAYEEWDEGYYPADPLAEIASLTAWLFGITLETPPEALVEEVQQEH